MEKLDGKATSKLVREDLKTQTEAFKQAGGKTPHIAVILVGHDPASETYVKNKIIACEETGFTSTHIQYEADISEEELLNKIEEINSDEDIDGLIVQLPLPKHINDEKVTFAIKPEKDVDGFHPVNVGRMAKNLPAYVSATPFGILELLKRYEIETQGKHCVVIGRSDIVGTPISILLSRNTYPGNCTVTLCHSRTKNIADLTQQADMVISALGKPGFVTGDMVKEGAIVIDVGITRVEDATKKKGFRLQGDVNFEEVSPKCSYITPVPGGVGPMTIAALLTNTLASAKREIYG